MHTQNAGNSLSVRARMYITALWHKILYEKTDEFLYFIKSVREYSHSVIVGTPGGVGTFHFLTLRRYLNFLYPSGLNLQLCALYWLFVLYLFDNLFVNHSRF